MNVKWQKETYKAVELSTNESPEVFKATLFSLTNVPPDRQKVMLKGTTIKEDWIAATPKLKNVTKSFSKSLKFLADNILTSRV